jgi:hypothetical protein
MTVIIISKIDLLGFLHQQNDKITKLNILKAGFCFHLQVEGTGRGERTESLSAGPPG